MISSVENGASRYELFSRALTNGQDVTQTTVKTGNADQYYPDVTEQAPILVLILFKLKYYTFILGARSTRSI
jgi:hypothetical protein